MMTVDRKIILFYSLLSCNLIVEGLPIQTSGQESLEKYRGLSKEEFDNMEECVKNLKVEVAESWNLTMDKNEINDTKFGDVAVNLEQCIAITDDFHKQLQEQATTEEPTNPEGSNSNGFRGWRRPPRPKRSAIDFTILSNLFRRWASPIKYHIKSGYFDATKVATIRSALDIWEKGTCIRFQEVAETDTDQRLEIMGLVEGCYSYIGKTNMVKQIVNLQPGGCTNTVGTAVHEIGHALGLFHEHQRPDRDQHVIINNENIRSDRDAEFLLRSDSATYNTPYDYGSVMHYTSNAFATSTSLTTIQTVDPEYQYTIGQRIEASFKDLTMINRMYECSCTSAALDCKNGGYPDPGTDSKCGACQCPQGLASDCTIPDAAGQSTGCTPASSELTATDELQCLHSPNYGTASYSAFDSCSWLIKADAGRQISLWFDLTDGFGVYYRTTGKICYHWVEIRHNGNLTETGPRHCGSASHQLNQENKMVSANNEVLVNFRSAFDISSSVKMVGFKLCFNLTALPTTTESATTVLPSTAAPTTAEPTTAEPTTAEPTTAEPTTAEPTTAEPTTAEPTTAKPTTAEPTTAEPTTAEPTTAEPTTAVPTTAKPTSAEPTTAEPTTSEPTTSEPTTSEPTTSKPTTSEPTTSEPTTSEATTSVPTTSEPTTSEPTTSEPTTSEPTTSEPTTSEPTTSEPTTSEPTTSNPTTSEPTTSEPTTSEPTTSELTTSEPITSEPTTSEPTTSKPTTATEATKQTASGEVCYKCSADCNENCLKTATLVQCDDDQFCASQEWYDYHGKIYRVSKRCIPKVVCPKVKQQLTIGSSKYYCCDSDRCNLNTLKETDDDDDDDDDDRQSSKRGGKKNSKKGGKQKGKKTKVIIGTRKGSKGGKGRNGIKIGSGSNVIKKSISNGRPIGVKIGYGSNIIKKTISNGRPISGVRIGYGSNVIKKTISNGRQIGGVRIGYGSNVYTNTNSRPSGNYPYNRYGSSGSRVNSSSGTRTSSSMSGLHGFLNAIHNRLKNTGKSNYGHGYYGKR